MKKCIGKQMVKSMKKAPVKKEKATTGRNKRPITFEFQGEPRQEVYVAGTFNDWNSVELKLKENGGGVYHASFQVLPGTYEYKFVVNGEWCADPNCPDVVRNAHGSINSVITVH